MAQVTIIGMGLIGTSLALALKNAKLANIKVVGYDRESDNLRTAHKKGATDSVENDLQKAVKDADLIVIATPVMAIKEVLSEIGKFIPAKCAVTDTGSTKQQVLKWAEEFLPEGASFIGGHPMAGKEKSGPEAADAALFKDKAWCIIPGRRAESWAVESVVTMIEGVGARPYFIDALEHDSFVAAVSHMPIALSSALISTTAASPSWHEIAPLASSGFRDVSRLASGDATMNRDIYLTNAEAITSWLDRVIVELSTIRRALAEKNDEALKGYFERVHEERDHWLAGAVSRPGSEAAKFNVPSASDQLSSVFLGEMLMKKGQRLMDQYEKDTQKRKKDGR